MYASQMTVVRKKWYNLTVCGDDMPNRKARQKISTTVAPETGAYLHDLIKQGHATNLSEAVDHAVRIARRAKSRARLEEATAAFYNSLSAADRTADNKLGLAMARASSKVNFDEE
jgi:hypothetical protein